MYTNNIEGANKMCTFEQQNRIEWKLCLHSKKCWVVSTQIWVKYGQTQILG